MRAEYILVAFLVTALFASIVLDVWAAKISSSDSKLRTYVLYSLYQELKRCNDLSEGKEVEGNFK